MFLLGAVATPSGETKEFTFASPPVSHRVERLESMQEATVDLFVKAHFGSHLNLAGFFCV